jgi:isoquinoline 1-oxidoreductase beta subunit
MTTAETSRRTFMKGAAATAAAAFVVGLTPNGALAAASPGTANGGNITPFVKITADGKIFAIVKHFEMGQGTTTGLTTLIAEELGVSMDEIDYEFAPADAGRYNNLLFGKIQGTGGSTAIANSYNQYRQAGAAARHMLLGAAAEAWGVEASTLTLEAGQIVGAGQSAPIAEFVAAAAKRTAPESPTLKDPRDFTLIGNPDVARRDNSGKINGTAPFAMDVQLDGQMVVVLKRPPRFRATATSIDATDAKDVPGFIDAKILPNKAGVVIYADKTWAAFSARDAVSVTWDFSNAESRSSDAIRQQLIDAVNAPAQFDVTSDNTVSDVAGLIEGADKVVEETFYFPYLAHAPMEPLNCTIEPQKDGSIILHDGCQMPTGVQGALGKILGLDPAQVAINTLYAGGSFGRRATPSMDYPVEAALAFSMTDRTRPVKLVWSREDDLAGGYYRPAFAHKVRIGLNGAGKIVGWDHRIAGQSIFKDTLFEGFMVKDGVDNSSVEGAHGSPYAIPGHYIGLSDAKPATSVNWWRSVGHSHTAYVMECMMDSAAMASGRDPVDFRMDYLANGTKDQQRIAGVLKLAAEKANWGTPPGAGRARGIAVHKSFGSFVAEVVEVARSSDDAISIEKVTCAVDCGVAVNPDVIRAQIEGGVGYGIGHVMRNEITLDGGEVVQWNFPDYEPLRIGDIKAIETHIVPSDEDPTGIGEPGTPPAGPALANAIAALGTRVTSLPMIKNGVGFA